ALNSDRGSESGAARPAHVLHASLYPRPWFSYIASEGGRPNQIIGRHAVVMFGPLAAGATSPPPRNPLLSERKCGTCRPGRYVSPWEDANHDPRAAKGYAQLVPASETR